MTRLYACRVKEGSTGPGCNPVCVCMCVSKMTEQLLTCGGMAGVKLHTYTRAHRHTHCDQSQSLSGWAWQLEICGSEDHLELGDLLHAQMRF